MKVDSEALRTLEGGRLFWGLLLQAIFAFAHIHRFILFRADGAKFMQLESTKERPAGNRSSRRH